MLIFKLQYEMAVLVIFVFMFYVRMTEWAKEETLILIQQIRNSNVWSTKSKEYKDANVCSDIFLRNWPFFQLENMEIKGKWHDMKTKLVDNWPKIGGGGMSCIKSASYTPTWCSFSSLKVLKNISADNTNTNPVVEHLL